MKPVVSPDPTFYGFPWKCTAEGRVAYGATVEAAVLNLHRQIECERLNKAAEAEAQRQAMLRHEKYEADRLNDHVQRMNRERILAEEQERRKKAREKYAKQRHLLAIRRRLKRVQSGFFRHRRLVHAALGNCGVL